MPVKSISAVTLSGWLADAARPRPVVLDVREPWEVALCRLDGGLAVPMREVPARLAEIDLEAPIVCVCHHGARSMQVALFLEARGAADVHNLSGGVAAWAQQVDPAFPTY